MPEYIEREAALRAILGQPPDAHYPGWYADSIKAVPAADVAPVVHGEWIFVDNDETGYQVKCSHCGTEFTFPAKKHLTKHCPECGAKMDGGD